MTVDGDGDGGEGDATNVRFTAAFSGHCPYFLLLLLLLLLLFIIISSLIKRAIEIQSNEAIQGRGKSGLHGAFQRINRRPSQKHSILGGLARRPIEAQVRSLSTIVSSSFHCSRFIPTFPALSYKHSVMIKTWPATTYYCQALWPGHPGLLAKPWSGIQKRLQDTVTTGQGCGAAWKVGTWS